MTHISAPSRRFRSVIAVAALLAATAFPALAGSQVARRLYSLPSSSDPRVSLPDTVSPRVKTASVLGHLGGDTHLTGMSLVLKPTDAQAAALQQLLADQQNPSSPKYHQWLTPQTFGEQFGLSDADLAIVKDWLTSKGFTVDEVAPSRNRIVFSGTASAVESAFTTTLQRFHRADQDYFENNTAISLPQSLAGVVSGITGISSYHIQPPVHAPQAVSPQFTNSAGTHYIVPWDFRQIFGMNTLISQGFDGTGIKIGVIGQSSVDSNQLTYFQQKTGQTVKLPTMLLIPNTGNSGQYSVGDEGESELDLEYASGSAPGATVLFIYTGLGKNSGVFDAMIYAVTNNLAPILTLSYGGCEASNKAYAQSTMEPVLAQASSQGQTILVSSGDQGAASCEPSSNNTTTATGGLSVSYPASSPNVTAVGGTQLNSDASTYWSSSNNSYGGSAIGYMPETSWNDTVSYKALSASGGGASNVFTKPSWQTGTGVPSANQRYVPDVAFPSAIMEHPYIVCTVGTYPCNGTAALGSGSSAGGGSLIGGTSAAAPNFAAMLAIVEQALGGYALGNINSQLYTLAAGSSASSIFHDITTGNNIVNCSGGSTGCSSTTVGTTGTMGYNAGVGYDEVTGLGSIDASGLTAGLKSSITSTTKRTPVVTVVAATTTPTGGATDAISITVAGPATGTPTPTGTVTLTIDGTAGSPITLVSGAASYTYTVPACTITTSTTCSHIITATYSGDTNYIVGTGTIALSVPTTGVVTSGSISLNPAAATLTVTAGNTGTDVITVSSTGFAGSITFKVASSVAISNACYTLPGGTITAGSQATTTFTIYTNSTNCTSASSSALQGGPTASTSHPSLPWRSGITVFAAGLVGAFFLRRRIRPTALLLVLFSTALFGVAGCGGSSSSSTSTGGSSGGTTSSTNTAKGTYPLTLTATGTPSNGAASVTATTNVTLVVQ